MERYRSGFDGVHASPAFKRRMLGMMREMSGRPASRASEDDGFRMPAGRKALLIAIAAILLLLSACAAYAVYWSSIVQAKEYAQSEQAVDDRLALAERAADEIIAGTTFYCPIEGSAEVDGIRFTLRSTAYETYDEPEMQIGFNATDAKAGDTSRLYDIDYVLTIEGTDYPAYAKAEEGGRALPAVARAEERANADYQIWFRLGEQKVPDGTAMTLSGTLYAYDDSDARGERLGSFSLDFVYEVQTEQIAAERERLIAKILQNLEEKGQASDAELAALSEETTPIGITQDEYTFHDALATQSGVVLGMSVVLRGAKAPKVYLDGYEMIEEEISSVFTPNQSQQELDVMWEDSYFGTKEAITRYPWYAPVDELPETVLVAVLRDAGSQQRRKGDADDGEPFTFTWDAVELLLRVNPRTGEITLPSGDAERAAWRAETERLAVDGRNASFTLRLEGEQTIGGVNVRLYDIMVNSPSRSVLIEWLVNGVCYPRESESSQARVYIDGVLQTAKAEAIKPYVFSRERADAWVKGNGGWQTVNSMGDFLLDMRALDLPDTFTLRVVWDLYDRNEDWERVFIGTFDLTTTVHKTDLAPWDSYN